MKFQKKNHSTARILSDNLAKGGRFMKFQKKLSVVVTALCLAFFGMFFAPDSVYAKSIASLNQAAQLAKKAVKNATVTEMDRDYEAGQLVYEIHLVKKTKEYEITYRASDGEMLVYGWEEYNVRKYSNKKTISKSKCRQLALKEAPGATILSLVQKYDDGVSIYKLKLDKGNKRYTMKYHAKTGKLIEYEWKLLKKQDTTSSSGNNAYIGLAKAKQIALAEVPDAVVVKAKFDTDDGVPVYEIELRQGRAEYEFKIHAKTGKILERDYDYDD